MENNLLDELVKRTHAFYVSDLPRMHCGKNWYKIFLSIPLGSYTMDQWSHALTYVFQYEINYDSEESMRENFLKCSV